MKRAGFLAVTLASCSLTAGGAGASSSALPRCEAGQLRISAGLQGATRSLLGTAVLRNPSARACSLPLWPRRVSLVIGTQLLPLLTVRSSYVGPPGVPTRRLPARGKVVVGIQWRNWCGAPRGNVRLRVGLTIYRAETRRVGVGLVTTPVCVDHRLSSRVAVSRFIRPSS